MSGFETMLVGLTVFLAVMALGEVIAPGPHVRWLRLWYRFWGVTHIALWLRAAVRTLGLAVCGVGVVWMAGCGRVPLSPSTGGPSVSRLIRDLAVEDQGNMTCNTACALLVARGDEAVPALRDALGSGNGRVREYAVLCLGQINTGGARSALVDAWSGELEDVRERAAYALALRPGRDAEGVYIEFLSAGRDEWHVRHAIKALGEIRSGKAAGALTRLRDHSTGWHTYYAAVVALRRIEGKDLAPETRGALDYLREAKYSKEIDMQRLAGSEACIRRDLQAALLDVFDIYIYKTKGNETKVAPSARSILCEAGALAWPVVRVGLRDPDENVSREARKLVDECGWDGGAVRCSGLDPPARDVY